MNAVPGISEVLASAREGLDMVSAVRPGAAQAPTSDEAQARLGEELRGWHRAKEAAKRHNRNLLQYGAGVAAAFGVGAGSGGVLAVANSLTPEGIGSIELGSFLFWVLGSVFSLSYVTIALAAIQAVLLVFTFFKRQAAEREAMGHLENLIALLPYHFLPARESQMAGVADQ
jgi:hypothetical protein